MIECSEIAPYPGGQTRFLSSSAFEVLFGGQAGPGKSYCLVMDALGLQFRFSPLKKAAIDFPGYKGVIFRRETGQLAELIGYARKMYIPFGAVPASQKRGEPGVSFTFPSGARIFLCHMEHEDDKESHHGIEYQFIGFDELTTFSLTQYLYLFTRCRSTIPGLWPRIRSTTNPVGPGLWWVRKRFITAMLPDVVGHYLAAANPELDPRGMVSDASNPDALSRTFIPGDLAENVALKADPQYRARIKAQGERMSRALLTGDWNAFGGEFFAPFSISTNVIPPFYIPKQWPLVLSIDPGFSSPCSAGLTTQDFHGVWYRIATYYERERNPEQNAVGIKAFVKSIQWIGDRWPEIIVSGKDAWAMRDKFSVIQSKKTFADVFQDNDIMLQPATTDRKPGWWAWRLKLTRAVCYADPDVPKKIIEKPTSYYVFERMNEPLIEEMISAVPDPKDEEDILGKGNDPSVRDHTLDEQRYGGLALPRPRDVQETDPETAWTKMFTGGKSGVGWKPGDG